MEPHPRSPGSSPERSMLMGAERGRRRCEAGRGRGVENRQEGRGQRVEECGGQEAERDCREEGKREKDRFDARKGVGRWNAHQRGMDGWMDGWMEAIRRDGSEEKSVLVTWWIVISSGSSYQPSDSHVIPEIVEGWSSAGMRPSFQTIDAGVRGTRNKKYDSPYLTYAVKDGEEQICDQKCMFAGSYVLSVVHNSNLQAIKTYRLHDSDTGSPEVQVNRPPFPPIQLKLIRLQVAILTEKIKYMTSHVQVSRHPSLSPTGLPTSL
eukprot:765028-Hanusia_phi.AAC.1